MKEFVTSSPSTLKMIVIPTSGNLDSDAWWTNKYRDVFFKMKFQIKELDIDRAICDV